MTRIPLCKGSRCDMITLETRLMPRPVWRTNVVVSTAKMLISRLIRGLWIFYTRRPSAVTPNVYSSDISREMEISMSGYILMKR